MRALYRLNLARPQRRICRHIRRRMLSPAFRLFALKRLHAPERVSECDQCAFAACVRRITDFPRISNSPHTGVLRLLIRWNVVVATKNSESAEKSGVFGFTDAISPACLRSCDRSSVGLNADSVVGQWWN